MARAFHERRSAAEYLAGIFDQSSNLGGAVFIRNAWYVGSWSHEIGGEILLSRKILGETLLFYRAESGAAVSLRDRCGHRFAPLSKGRREGDGVRCMYHGLLFNREGRCIEEPGRKSGVSPHTAVRRYPTVERYKQVWVWMGDPDLADPGLIPDCRFQDDPAWASIPAYIHYKADYRLILDNLMDFSHLTFVHATTLGGSASIATTHPKIETLKNGARLTRWYLGEPEIAPYLRGFSTFDGPVDRWHVYELDIRGNVFTMDSGSAPAGTGAPEGHLAPEAMQFRATQIITPEDEHGSHFFWTYAHNFNTTDTAFTRKLADRIAQGFEEDRLMIEAQQAVIDVSGDDQMGYIRADNALTILRRMIDERIAGERSLGSPLPRPHLAGPSSAPPEQRVADHPDR